MPNEKKTAAASASKPLPTLPTSKPLPESPPRPAIPPKPLKTSKPPQIGLRDFDEASGSLGIDNDALLKELNEMAVGKARAASPVDSVRSSRTVEERVAESIHSNSSLDACAGHKWINDTDTNEAAGAGFKKKSHVLKCTVCSARYIRWDSEIARENNRDKNWQIIKDDETEKLLGYLALAKHWNPNVVDAIARKEGSGSAREPQDPTAYPLVQRGPSVRSQRAAIFEE